MADSPVPREFLFDGSPWLAHDMGESDTTIEWYNGVEVERIQGRNIRVASQDGDEMVLLGKGGVPLHALSDSDLGELIRRRRQKLEEGLKKALEIVTRNRDPVADKITRSFELARAARSILRIETDYARKAFDSARWTGDFNPKSPDAAEIARILEDALTWAMDAPIRNLPRECAQSTHAGPSDIPDPAYPRSCGFRREGG